MRTRIAFHVACTAAAATVLVCGCTSTVRTSPDNVKIEPPAVSHLPARNVTLANGHATETQVTFKTGVSTVIVEPKHMTDTAVEMLRRALALRGEGKGPAKRVTLKVHSPRVTGPTGVATGLAITIDADYGDGTRSQVSGDGYSARGANRSFEVALQTALNRLLSDPRFVAYMKR